MKKIILLFLLVANIWAVELNQKQAEKIQQCQVYTSFWDVDYLVELFRTSSYDFKAWGMKPSEVNLMYDSRKKSKLIYTVMDASIRNADAPSHIMGFIRFDISSGKLEESSPEPDVYTALNYNPLWKDIVISVYNNPKRSYIQMSQKSYLYNEPNENAKTDKFLIKNDCALVVKKTKDWYLVYFHHNRLKTDTLMWMKAEDVNKCQTTR